MKPLHRQPIQIRFNDIDLVGHLNNAVYLEYFDLAKVQFFNQALADLTNWVAQGFVLAHITADYLCPVYLDDPIEVTTRLVRLGNKSLELEQEVVSHETGVVHCRSRSVMVCMDYLEKQAIPLPERWRERLTDYLRTPFHEPFETQSVSNEHLQ